MQNRSRHKDGVEDTVRVARQKAYLTPIQSHKVDTSLKSWTWDDPLSRARELFKNVRIYIWALLDLI